MRDLKVVWKFLIYWKKDKILRQKLKYIAIYVCASLYSTGKSWNTSAKVEEIFIFSNLKPFFTGKKKKCVAKSGTTSPFLLTPLYILLEKSWNTSPEVEKIFIFSNYFAYAFYGMDALRVIWIKYFDDICTRNYFQAPLRDSLQSWSDF